MLTSKIPLALATLSVLLVGWSALAGPGLPARQPRAEASTGLDAATLRQQGPAGLRVALEHYDALPPGPERLRAASLVDRVAAQKYATQSRLYWYTDLEAAKRAARLAGKPIVSLRLLGRLDEDFSCANSRLFRTVLYADPKVSAYLRNEVILHWSSERDVPTITIDFGAGRTMKSTVGGNSAHYLLSSDGLPVDVIPGLYAPAEFLAALRPGLALAARMVKSKDRERLLRDYHQEAIASGDRAFASLGSARRAALLPYRQAAEEKKLVDAEVLTMSKMIIEAPVARAIAPESAAVPDPQAVHATIARVKPLSAQSRALIAEIGPTDWAAAPAQVQGAALDAILSSLARRVATDSLINEYGLRPRIHQLFVAQPAADFAALNAQIYADIFVTPADDPWLGMAQPEGFSGLPGDGLASAAAF